MANEIEAKIKVVSFAPIRAALDAAGAQYLGAHEETDQFYDTPKCDLRGGDCGLRLRISRALDRPMAAKSGGVGGKTRLDASAGPLPLLTYKGPRRRGGKLKVRPEVQSRLADAKSMGKILQSLGYSPTIIVRKRRSSYRLMGCQVELDELRGIGRFVEVEGPSARAVNKVVRTLQIQGEPITTSYVSMVAKRLAHRQT